MYSIGLKCVTPSKTRPMSSTDRESATSSCLSTSRPVTSVNYFDPKLGEDREDTDFSAPDDTIAKKRLDLKRSMGVGRGHRRRLLGGAASV